MLVRYLLPLALLICLAAAPTALAANDEDAPGGEPATCVQPSDADADNVSEEDLCETGEAGGGAGEPGACAPTPPPGNEPGGTPPGETGGEPGEAGDEPGDDAGEGDEPDEIDLPFESRREYRDFCETPAFEAGFLRRAWRFGGEATGFGDGVLTIRVGSAPRVPARFREQAGRLVGLEAAVLVGRRTDVVSARRARRSSRGGRRGSARRVSQRSLRRAGRVQVQGKLLPPSRWRQDANGQRIPTVRATKITLGG